jgi:hypothetical protein
MERVSENITYNQQTNTKLLTISKSTWICRGPQWNSGYGAVLQIGRPLVRSQLVSVEFFIGIKSFRSHYDPGVDSASNRNEYQEHLLGVEAAGA